MTAATGARRGELLALGWSDIQEGRVLISRSLTQTKQVLTFKETKTPDSVRVLRLPASTHTVINAHRLRQNEFREQCGADYHADLDLILVEVDGSPLKPDSVSSAASLLFQRLQLPKGASLH